MTLLVILLNCLSLCDTIVFELCSDTIEEIRVITSHRSESHN
jgi:hypothetical protein